MTGGWCAAMSLPTRDELAKLLHDSDSMTVGMWSSRREPEREKYYSMADALLTRLRLEWDSQHYTDKIFALEAEVERLQDRGDVALNVRENLAVWGTEEATRAVQDDWWAFVALVKAVKVWLDHPDRGLSRHLSEEARAIAVALANPAVQRAVTETK